MSTGARPPGAITKIRASWFVICGSLLVLAVTWSSCQPSAVTKNEPDEARAEGERPETEFTKQLPPPEIRSQDKLDIPETPAGKAVLQHIDAIYTVGEGAEERYQESLKRLRENPDEVVRILSGALSRIDRQYYGDRWVLIQTLSDLEAPEALPPLLRLADQDLPRRDSLYVDQIDPYEEESILRITAIQGVAKLAATEPRAARAIRGYFSHKDSTIRLEALNSFADVIRTVEDRRLREELIQLLPANYEFELTPVHPPPSPIAGESANLKPSGEGLGPPPQN